MGKGDLWYQLAHLVDPHDIEDYDYRMSPESIELTDRLEKFFSDFANLWRRGADKEICDSQGFWGLKLADVRAEKKEAWDLIDRMLPYVKGQLDTHSMNSMDLLAEIVEKRKAHA